MITTIVIKDLTIGTLSSGYIITKLNGFGFPSVRVDVTDRGSMHGADLGAYLYGRRIFTIELEILGLTPSDYETKRRELEEVCDIFSGLTTLTIYTKSGLSLQNEVIISADIDMPYERGNVIFSTARLELTSPYPFIKSLAGKAKNITMWSGGGWAVPMAIPLSMTAGASVIDTATNDGNAVSYPIITLNGQLEDPVVINEVTGEEMSVGYHITDGHYIEIDTYNRTALLDGVTNVRQYITGDWLKLVPAENPIKLSATSFNANASALISYKDSYLGI